MLFEDFLEKKRWGKSVSGLVIITSCYAIISMLIANGVFSANAGIVGIAFLTIFLLPVIQNIRDTVEAPFHFKEIAYGEPSTIRSYAIIFATVFTLYGVIAFILPLLGFSVTQVFKEQLQAFLPVGQAVAFSGATFSHIMQANLFVLVLAFTFGFIWIDSGIFFVLWNASTWGATFGFRAVAASAAAGTNPWYYLGVLLIQVIWHAILEGGAYVLAAAAGGMIGHAAYQHKEKPFLYGIAVLVGAIAVVSIRSLGPVISIFINLAVLAIVLVFVNQAIPEMDKNYVVQGAKWFGYAILLFFIGAVVETVVLSNSQSVSMIYAYANMFITGS